MLWVQMQEFLDLPIKSEEWPLYRALVRIKQNAKNTQYLLSKYHLNHLSLPNTMSYLPHDSSVL